VFLLHEFLDAPFGGGGVEIRILGPVELWGAGEQWPLGRAKERGILGVLALSSGRHVSPRTLLQALWDDHPPKQVQKNIQAYISQLRKCLRDSGTAAKIITQRGAYLLDSGDESIDYVEFKSLLNAGRVAQHEGSLDNASGYLRKAVSLWTGPPVADLSTIWMEHRREELDNYELVAAYQALCDVELGRGQYREVLQLLDEVMVDHELDSKYIEQRLAALDGLGHYADFDTHWRQVYRRNVESFGTGPPRELHDFHAQLIHDRDRPAPSKTAPGDTAPIRPAQLPPLTSGFLGRSAEISWLHETHAEFHIADAGTPLIIVLTGLAGVGKTEIGLQWAHTIRKEYRDGQLYADLNGYAQESPAAPAAVIGDFLETLGIRPSDVPTKVAARSALLRTLLDGKRFLIFLDDAHDSQQVQPLIPSSPNSLLLVTSRHLLSDLVIRNGARRLPIPPLSLADSLALLQRLLHAVGVDQHDSVSLPLAEASGGLPSAVRAAAEVAASGQPLDGTDLLSAGEDPSRTLRASFTRSYGSLHDNDARMFRFLSRHPGPDFTPLMAAVVADVPEQRAREALATLRTINLINGVGDRFSFHRLVLAFAREMTITSDGEDERVAALRRLAQWFLDQISRGASILEPEVFAWVERERVNIASVIEAAADRQWPIAWRALRVLRPYIERESPRSDWVPVHEAALLAAQRAGDDEGQAATLVGLAIARRRAADHESEHNMLMAALEMLDADRYRLERIDVLNRLAANAIKRSNLSAAATMSAEAMTLHHQDDNPAARARTHLQLGTVCTHQDDLDDASSNLLQARRLFDQAGDRPGAFQTVTALASIRRRQGRNQDAVAVRDAGTLTVHDTTQYPYGVKEMLTRKFRLQSRNVRVLAPYIGGGFGGKTTAWPHVSLAVAAAKLTHRPVKLVLSRTDMFSLTGGRSPTESRIALAADANGRLTALEHDALSICTKDEFAEAAVAYSRHLYACPNINLRERSP
jgi:DNA-binding SARP family transcriptional activator